ncbi:MAG TPA: 2-hydroxymuconate tautomerase [Candidatus Saccharicenans sp.]|nr:2-hydroxymuconate tautomerase [Candidatus Saccharicenans sp.]
MPLVEIHLLAGRSKEQKKALLEAVTAAVQQSINASLDTIKVWIQEFPPDEYMSGGVLASEKKQVSQSQ